MQKRTFTKWINSHLAKVRKPILFVHIHKTKLRAFLAAVKNFTSFVFQQGDGHMTEFPRLDHTVVLAHMPSLFHIAGSNDLSSNYHIHITPPSMLHSFSCKLQSVTYILADQFRASAQPALQLSLSAASELTLNNHT